MFRQYHHQLHNGSYTDGMTLPQNLAQSDSQLTYTSARYGILRLFCEYKTKEDRITHTHTSTARAL